MHIPMHTKSEEGTDIYLPPHTPNSWHQALGL